MKRIYFLISLLAIFNQTFPSEVTPEPWVLQIRIFTASSERDILREIRVEHDKISISKIKTIIEDAYPQLRGQKYKISWKEKENESREEIGKILSEDISNDTEIPKEIGTRISILIHDIEILFTLFNDTTWYSYSCRNNSSVGSLRVYLQNSQKRSDFYITWKPRSEQSNLQLINIYLPEQGERINDNVEIFDSLAEQIVLCIVQEPQQNEIKVKVENENISAPASSSNAVIQSTAYSASSSAATSSKFAFAVDPNSNEDPVDPTMYQQSEDASKKQEEQSCIIS